MAKHEQDGMSDEWYTPRYIFDALNCNFDTDVAAPVDRTYCHVPADVFITENSLDLVWNGFCWMNAPFGSRNSKGVWLDKLSAHGHGIALTPDRTSAPWWQHAARKASAIFQVDGKIHFIKPDGTTGDSPSTGTTLFAYGGMATVALAKAELNGLGLIFVRP